MHAMTQRLRKLARTAADRGASAVEYGLMVAAIAALIVGVVFALGGIVKQTFIKTCSAIESGTSTAADPTCDGTAG